MVDEICAVMRIIYPLPTKRKFVICAVLGPLFLHPRKPWVQPMTRPRIMIDKVGLPFVRVSFFPVGRQGSQGVMGQGLPIGHGARWGLQPLVGVFGHIGWVGMTRVGGVLTGWPAGFGGTGRSGGRFWCRAWNLEALCEMHFFLWGEFFINYCAGA